jgi:phage virion morphogenesis protein
MAGIRIKVDDSAIQTALHRVAEKDGGLVVASLKVVGQYMVTATRQRFRDQVDPSGQAWKALNPGYAAGKSGTKILQELGLAGGLMGSITAQLNGTTLQIGTNKVYGAIHQFGGTIVPRNYPALVFRINGKLCFAHEVTIPARPYLGVSAADRAEIPLLVQDVLDAAAGP